MLNLVTAIIKPHRLESVKEALQGAGVTGMTVTDVQGFGRQGGHTETYRGAEYVVDFVPKMKVEIVTSFDNVDKIMDVIRDAALSGEIGDGKVWSSSVERLMRIRTGEMGADAI